MNILARAMAFIGRVQALGVKESALRYYRSGDIHQLYGTQVGTDKAGNLYYEALPGTAGLGRERWVWYANKKQEASTIPPEWHQWLHHVVDEIPSQAGLAAFRPHFLRGRTPNQTGTSKAYSSPHYLGNKSWTGGPSKKFESWDANASKASSSSEASSSSTAL